MFSWEYDILGTLLRHKAGSLQDTVEIQLGSTMLLALRWPLGHQLLGIHLRPVRLDRPLHGFKPWAGTHKPIHKSKVAVGHGLGRP